MYGQDGIPSVSDAKLYSIAVTPTITSGSAYSSGNALGGKLTLANPVRYSGGPAKLVAIIVADKAGQKAAIDVLLFNQDFTATTDKSATAISAGDLLNMCGHVNVATTDYADVGSSKSIATKVVSGNGLALQPVSASGATSLYAQLVVRGTPTYTSTSDIQVKFVFERE